MQKRRRNEARPHASPRRRRDKGARCDNKSARDVIKCPGATKRTVHFDRWLHFARELVLMNKAEIFFAPTDMMMADGMTKAVDKTKFLKCRDYVMSSV